ncbi:bifunctional hydroxymethylpyrimidine kinase/phosphomethylpyrimidine kinase [Pikeienuella piscinae]|uniref:hydroxymethylpyrimidine kinase n=1 Tax=Pikeienuella piscinae TaxID=2748098 RepID=A0A7L5BVV5_9RHOB|nr:bifunctional hydroxymethylpyrimidine kinase/phosphomethylpyrimidine kinase [Pikeienuella piscinae]QIE54647.1 bifunctional hydroxymethylpyrimidine kinase/phosphomethylpyrimidine kinase [Pikeienuella piscinae]
MIPNVLSIAGSDPSGGAGIQADLKAIAANGGYAMAAITALTAQNTQGVTGVETVAPAFVAAQIDAVFDDIRVDAVKIGMIATAGIAEAVATALIRNGARNVVLDPVMVAKGGHRLLTDDTVGALRDRLLPLADIVTPNLPEAAALLDEPEAVAAAEMEAQARRLRHLGSRAALLKGGHLTGAQSPDCLADQAGEIHWLDAPRTKTRNTHGTGCTLSAALATRLAGGCDAPAAARAAKDYVSGAISAADRLEVGRGHGPVHHFHKLWRNS